MSQRHSLSPTKNTKKIMKKKLLLPIALLIAYSSFSQGVGIGTATPDASAALDVTATNKGLLIPRMNTASMLAIVSPANGLMIYDTQTNQLKANIGTPAAPNWQPVASNAANAWNIAGNAGINPANQFVGTTDNQPLRFRINNVQAGELNPSGNIFWGLRAGEGNTTGFSNIAIGTDALKFNKNSFGLVAIGDSALFNNDRVNPSPGVFAAHNVAIGNKSLFSNTFGSNNTATGDSSLFSNTQGNLNSAYGSASLFSNIGGGFNTAIGGQSMAGNTTGNFNTAIGANSLLFNTTGFENTASGVFALSGNTTGNNNTASGYRALSGNTTGNFNTAFGSHTLFFNQAGAGNTAIGDSSLFSNTGGGSNTAIGNLSLLSNTAGNFNTAAGSSALFSNITGNENTGLGHNSLASNTTGSSNTAVGSESLVANGSGNENTAVGTLSLVSNATGNSNTATGSQALALNFSGNFNTAIGNESLFLNSIGSANTSVGHQALANTVAADFNTAVGSNAGFQFNMGPRNTLIGANTDVTQNGISNSVVLGEGGRATASNQVRFGNASTTSIGGIVGFTNLSDGRYKKNVKEDVKGIDFIMKLRPVTYQLDMAGINDKLKTGVGNKTNDLQKKGIDENGKTIHSGFVAQEVEQAAKDASYNFSGIDKPKNENDMYGLRYADFVVPIIKAVQEQQQMIKLQQQMMEELKNQNTDLQKRILALEKK